jgi:hypothetical protein
VFTVRTTLTIDDAIAKALEDLAQRSNRRFEEVVNQTLHADLEAHATACKPYRVQPASLGSAFPGIDLDKALALADALEDQEIVARIERRARS